MLTIDLRCIYCDNNSVKINMRIRIRIQRGGEYLGEDGYCSEFGADER